MSEAAEMKDETKQIGDIERELDREFYKREQAAQALKTLSDIGDVRRVIHKQKLGTVEIKVGSSMVTVRTVEIGTDALEEALKHEEKYLHEQLKECGVSFGEWA